MTLADILVDLNALIGPGNYATPAQLTGWINEAYLYICDQLVQENPNYFTTSSIADLVAGQMEYGLPGNCERIVMLNVNFSGTFRRVLPLEEINQVPVLASANNPVIYDETSARYYTVGNNIGILPIVTTTQVNGIQMWFTQNITELGSADIPLFASKYHRLIKWGAYANYLDLDDQHAQAEQVRNRFDQRIQEMVQTLAERQLDEPKSIIVVDNGLDW